MKRSILVLGAALIAFAVLGAATTLNVKTTKVDSFTVDQVANSDVTAPTVTAREFFDTNTDGKIDQVRVTYNEPLGSYAGTTSDWTLNSGRPSGMSASPASVVTSGSQVLLDWTTLSAAPATAATMNLTLSSSTAVQDQAGNFAASFSNQPVADKAAPAVLTAEYFDTGTPNGKIDQIKVTYGETLANTTATAPWSISGGPTGMDTSDLTTVSTSGAVITLTFSETAGTATSVATAAPTLTVSLDNSTAAVKDAANNAAANLTSRATTDKAAPVFVDFTDSDTSGASPDGLFEDDDWIEFHFSEAMDLATTTNPSSVTVTEGPNTQPDSLAIPGLVASTSLGSDGYLAAANNAVTTYSASLLTLLNSDRTIHVELSGCAPAGAAPCTQRTASSGTVTLTILSSVKGTDGLAVTGTVAKTAYRMM